MNERRMSLDSIDDWLDYNGEKIMNNEYSIYILKNNLGDMCKWCEIHSMTDSIALK